MLSLESVVEIFREAGASEEDIKKVEDIIEKMLNGIITNEEAYYAIIGLARENLIPLTPRQVGDLRRLLKVE